MWSILPATVAVLFLLYGMYVVASRGLTRLSAPFLLLCLLTFLWQGLWALLFQVRDGESAFLLARIGYFFILFLPTALYHFLVELAEAGGERRWVLVSYVFSSVLAGFLLASDWFVEGCYFNAWGAYPKAGPLHPLHVAQTALVVGRGLFIARRRQRTATLLRHAQLRHATVAMGVFFFAAVDYLCNYGFAFYPPGVLFVALALGIIARAVVRFSLMDPKTMAAAMAHEMRTPLAAIRMGAEGMALHLPRLIEGYEQAVAHGLRDRDIRPPQLAALRELAGGIMRQADRSNVVVDTLLAALRLDDLEASRLTRCGVGASVGEAMQSYPFAESERALVSVDIEEEFEFRGAQPLLVCVLINLIKNGLHAISVAGRGDIRISARRGGEWNVLTVRDTGSGIAPEVLPKIFKGFFTTKAGEASDHKGHGIGLAFCAGVMQAFGGRIRCESAPGVSTSFTLEFPALR